MTIAQCDKVVGSFLLLELGLIILLTFVRLNTHRYCQAER